MEFPSDIPITVDRNTVAFRVNGSGYLESVPANEARLDFNPITKEIEGLLIEDSFTNLITYSEDFTQAAWVKGNGTITDAAVASPIVGNMADRFTNTNTSSANMFFAATGVTASNRKAASAFFKKRDTDWICITLQDATNGIRFWANINTGAIGSTSVVGSGISSVGFRTEMYADGWVRVIVCALWNSSTNFRIELWPALNSDASIVSTNGSSNYVWGAMGGIGEDTGSYIQTTGSTVQRLADKISLPSDKIVNSLEFTLFAEIKVRNVWQTTQRRGGLIVQDAAAGNYAAYAGRNRTSVSPTTLTDQVVNAGVLQINADSSVALAANTILKHALRVKTNDIRGCWNGTLNTLVSSAVVPTAIDTIYLGARNLGIEPLNGWVRKAYIYGRGLSDADLQTLTA